MSKVLLALVSLAACGAGFPLAGRQTASRTLEAEDAELTGVEVLTELEGFSGTGYVGGFDEATDKLTWSVPSNGTTLYDVTLRYAGPNGEKTTSIVLNGGASSDVVLPESEGWVDLAAGQVLLEQGTNTIDIVSNWGWYLIDSITLSESAPRPPHNINEALVNANANADAVQLYDYLRSIYGTNILSGQQELEWAEWVEEQTGKAPALVSVDLMDYSPSRVEYQGDVGTAIEEAIAFSDRGGIISVLWHWNAPTGLYDTDEQPWWSGFYTEATDFNVATALSDTSNANYTLIVRDIDAIATELLRLQDAGVPVLFRPLHEAEGAWFWWGAQGPEACKKLYALLYDRLTNVHGLNNLIWIWNSIDEDWYPGADTVDIVSADVYATGNGPMSTQYGQLIELGEDAKLIAATEVGSAPLPEQLIAYEAHWLWFCVWGDSFINNDEYNSPEVLNEIYNHDYVLTLDEVQGWRS